MKSVIMNNLGFGDKILLNIKENVYVLMYGKQ